MVGLEAITQGPPLRRPLSWALLRAVGCPRWPSPKHAEGAILGDQACSYGVGRCPRCHRLRYQPIRSRWACGIKTAGRSGAPTARLLPTELIWVSLAAMVRNLHILHTHGIRNSKGNNNQSYWDVCQHLPVLRLLDGGCTSSERGPVAQWACTLRNMVAATNANDKFKQYDRQRASCPASSQQVACATQLRHPQCGHKAGSTLLRATWAGQRPSHKEPWQTWANT